MNNIVTRPIGGARAVLLLSTADGLALAQGHAKILVFLPVSFGMPSEPTEPTGKDWLDELNRG